MPSINLRNGGQEFREMFCYTDRTYAGATAAMGNAKGFVQVEMANISADVTGPTQADLRVHVGAVHVNLTAMRVHQVANFANGGFEDAVG